MEPKNTMHSEPQKEVKDSAIKPEFIEQKEPVNTGGNDDLVEKKSGAPEITKPVENNDRKKDVPTEELVEPAEALEKQEEEQQKEEDSKVETEEAAPVEQDKEEGEKSAGDASKEKGESVGSAEAPEKQEEEDSKVGTEEAAPVEQDKEEGEKSAGDTSKEKGESAGSAEAAEETGVDYSKFTEVELINELRDLIDNKDFIEIHQKVDTLKLNFYKKHKLKIQEQKKNFLDAGGFEEEFKTEADPYEQDLKKLLVRYRQKKSQYNKQLEAEKEENLKKKYEIIEEIKNLVNRKESINKTFQEFKELQQKWHDIGLVPQANMKDLWETYHHHVENFYDYIKINKELRDLDLKKNMEGKISLCEKAEALLIEPSVIKAFNSLQKLHDAWREIGPVPRDKKEELWGRFKDATTKINKKHQEFFENRKKSQKKNLETKTALCEKVEEIAASEITTYKEWEEKSKEIIELQKYWRTIGFAPRKDNNTIYERFRMACDGFFDKKREFYAKHKEIQANNLQQKIDLCLQAEALKESTDWRKTTEEYIAIQKKWKEIGPVPRKNSDSVWKRFRTACDYFFNRKKEFFNTIDETQVENLKAKNELIDEVLNFELSGDDGADFEELKEFQRRWTEIGHVPIANKNDVQKRFRDSINTQFDKLRIDDKDRNLLKFKNKVSGLRSTSRGQNKIYAERDKYVNKLKHLENDLITLKNNIGFFASSKNAEALIKDVKQKIKNNEEQIEYLKEKIQIIDETDNNNE